MTSRQSRWLCLCLWVVCLGWSLCNFWCVMQMCSLWRRVVCLWCVLHLFLGICRVCSLWCVLGVPMDGVPGLYFVLFLVCDSFVLSVALGSVSMLWVAVCVVFAQGISLDTVLEMWFELVVVSVLDLSLGGISGLLDASHTCSVGCVVLMLSVLVVCSSFVACSMKVVFVAIVFKRGSRGGGPGVRTPPLRFVRGGVLCRGLMGRRGGPTVVSTLLLSIFFWLASLASIIHIHYMYTYFHVQYKLSSFLYISLIQITSHPLLFSSRITRFYTI